MIDELFKKYKQKGILIDTNILLLWFVGSVNRNRISRFNRTEKFIPEDYDVLLNILRYFSKIVTTPNILTEVNSLINQIGEPERTQCLEIMKIGIRQMQEFYIESSNTVEIEGFTKFGLTDTGIVSLARDGLRPAEGYRYLVLTDDLRLAHYLQNLGIDTVNFNHIRVYGWK